LQHQRALNDLSPEFFDCPIDCEHGEQCEALELETAFREKLTERLDDRCEGWQSNFSLTYLINLVREIASIASDDLTRPKQTLATSRLVSVWNNEKERARKIDDWNDKQKRKNKNLE